MNCMAVIVCVAATFLGGAQIDFEIGLNLEAKGYEPTEDGLREAFIDSTVGRYGPFSERYISDAISKCGLERRIIKDTESGDDRGTVGSRALYMEQPGIVQIPDTIHSPSQSSLTLSFVISCDQLKRLLMLITSISRDNQVQYYLGAEYNQAPMRMVCTTFVAYLLRQIGINDIELWISDSFINTKPSDIVDSINKVRSCCTHEREE